MKAPHSWALRSEDDEDDTHSLAPSEMATSECGDEKAEIWSEKNRENNRGPHMFFHSFCTCIILLNMFFLFLSMHTYLDPSHICLNWSIWPFMLYKDITHVQHNLENLRFLGLCWNRYRSGFLGSLIFRRGACRSRNSTGGPIGEEARLGWSEEVFQTRFGAIGNGNPIVCNGKSSVFVGNSAVHWYIYIL